MQQTKKAAATKGSNPFSVSKRHSMPAHEALLLNIQKYLPDLLVSELQSAEPLNELIRSNADDWKRRIEDLVATKGLKGSEAKIWRGIPDLCFGNPDLAPPNIELGTTLIKTMESQRSSRGWAPILVADCSMTIAIPNWNWIYLRDGEDSSYPEAPIAKSSDGLSLNQTRSNVPVFGQVFPQGCPLGEVALEMARLADAVELHLSNVPEFRSSDSRKHVMLVTDSWTIFDALAGQYDAVLFPTDDDSASWSFEKLQTFHTAKGF